MKKRPLFTIIMLAFILYPIIAQDNKKQISDNIDVIQLSNNVYLHISYLETQNWGKVRSNGLLIVKDGEAIMIDTPWDNEQTGLE